MKRRVAVTVTVASGGGDFVVVDSDPRKDTSQWYVERDDDERRAVHMKTAPQQSRLKIIPWDVIKANEAAGAVDLTQTENEDDIFSLDETEQQKLPTLALPDPLREKLFTHQHYGVNWMFNLFNQNERGGILADDMGLGKTLQVTSFLAGTMMVDRLYTSLVLAPKSVIPSWERELNNNLKAHLPEVQVVVIDANMKKKQRTTLLGAVEASNRRSKHIIIMTHHLLLTMIEEVERICWDCVVLDEGHIIKNTTTKMSQTMHQLRSPFRLLLSGTPIQNDLKEFWALVNWATQGSRFGREADFRKTFADPILRGQDPSAGERSRALAAEARLSLIRVIRPVLLRRKKADQRQKELQLPEKKELVLWIRLSTKQRQQYYEYVHSRRYEEVMRQATYPVEVINTLKTICRHPILLRADQHKDVDELDAAMQRLGLGDAADEAPSQSHGKGHFFDVLGRVPSKDELLSQSTKLRVLARMTSRLVNEDHRVLIFSQSKRMLDVIQFLFVDYGYPTFKIDGSTSSEERQNIIDEFNTPGDEYCGPKICLLTTKACGVGINLVGADRVIIFDPSWNPAEDSQAVDRAYRIGQTKPVIVYRLIHSSCVEEKVYQKQVFKEGLRVISEKGNETKRYFAEKSQLRELLALGGKDAVDILRQVPNKMDLLQLDGLFGMDSVIGCTRHDRLYKEDDAPAAAVEVDARSCREEALQGRYPVPQPIAAHAMAQQAKRTAAPTKKATPEPPFRFDDVCEDDNRHPTVDLCDSADVESLASTSGACRGRANASSAPCIDLTQNERRGGANSQRSSDASDRMKELRQLRQQPSASQPEPEPEPEPTAAMAPSSQPPADSDPSQPATPASPVDVAVRRAPAPRHTPGLLHEYCNVSLFSPSSTGNASGVDLSALDACDSRRSSTASVAEQSPAAVAAPTVAAADPPRRTPLRPAADQFRWSLCDHKRRQLYQQLQQTPLRTPQRPAGSGYLSRIKVIGSSMKTPAAATRPGATPQSTAAAAAPHGDGRVVAGLSSGFVDRSFMDSDYDDASGRSSDASRLSLSLSLSLDKENAPNRRQSSASAAAASVGKATRARAFSHEASCEIAAELARLVEATHEHAADEEQRRYDEESDERRRGGDSPSVGDLVDQLATMNVADLARGAPALLSSWRASSPVDGDAGPSSGLGSRDVHKTLSFDEDAPLAA
eukprot:gene4447-3180_t